MRVNELRIGNTIHFKNPKGEIVEHVVDLTTLQWLVEDESFFNKVHFPIPITEECLLKFGFTKPAHSWIGDVFHLSEWDAYPLNWCVAMNKNNAIIYLKLKYVHQLQNLYFALTGEELAIKE